MPRLPALLLLLPAFAALWIAVSEFAHLRLLDQGDPATSLQSMRLTQPWGGLAGREAARLLERRWRPSPDIASEALEWQLGNYPLSPWRWLLFTRMAVADRVGERELTNFLATAISVQPHSPRVRWEAANLAQITGRKSLVFRQLRLLLEVQPNATDRALFIGSRWSNDIGELLDHILPQGEEYLRHAMRRARRSDSMALAEATWSRYMARPNATVGPNDPVFSDYIHLALRHDEARAMAAWQVVDEGYRPGDLPAGDFSWPLEALPSFGWSVHMPDGARLERVALERQRMADGADQGRIPGANALRITFNGEKNIRLASPSVRFPAAAPGMYRLHGWWRAEGLTTRALPYLELSTQSGEHRSRKLVAVPAPEFGWMPFAIDYSVHEAGQPVTFRLRRDPTDAFDRYIEGRILLAGLSVASLLPSTIQTSAPVARTHSGDQAPSSGNDCRADDAADNGNDCREASRP